MNLYDIKQKKLVVNNKKIIDLQLQIFSDTKVSISYPSGENSLIPSNIKISLIGFVTKDKTEELEKIEIGYVNVFRFLNDVYGNLYHYSNIKDQLSSEEFSRSTNDVLNAINEIKKNCDLHCQIQNRKSLFYISTVFVNKKLRNNGIGEFLISETEKLLNALYESNPFIFLVAFPFETSKENPKKEINKLNSFYTKCGFKPLNNNIFIKNSEE